MAVAELIAQQHAVARVEPDDVACSDSRAADLAACDSRVARHVDAGHTKCARNQSCGRASAGHAGTDPVALHHDVATRNMHIGNRAARCDDIACARRTAADQAAATAGENTELSVAERRRAGDVNANVVAGNRIVAASADDGRLVKNARRVARNHVARGGSSAANHRVFSAGLNECNREFIGDGGCARRIGADQIAQNLRAQNRRAGR